MNKLLRIAIDGPGGAGKSTVAKIIAEKLEIDYVDTGAMYRAIGYKMDKMGIAPDDTKNLEKALSETEIKFNNGVFLDGENVENKIRTQEVSTLASLYSAIPVVRKKLVEIQRNMAKKQSLVMDGRDTATNVMPFAEKKFYITASPEVRAMRRTLENREKYGTADYDQILKEIKERDRRDTTRELNPLKKAEDAIVIDTGDMDVDEVVKEALRCIQNN